MKNLHDTERYGTNLTTATSSSSEQETESRSVMVFYPVFKILRLNERYIACSKIRPGKIMKDEQDIIREALTISLWRWSNFSMR